VQLSSCVMAVTVKLFGLWHEQPGLLFGPCMRMPAKPKGKATFPKRQLQRRRIRLAELMKECAL
jgi:hypothetical protein